MKRHDIKRLRPTKKLPKSYQQRLNEKGILTFKQHVAVLHLMWLAS